jgi:hypothetical protein
MIASRRVFNACLRKHAYASREDAAPDLAALVRKARPEARGLFHAYRCDFCGQWHIGRRRAGSHAR